MQTNHLSSHIDITTVQSARMCPWIWFVGSKEIEVATASVKHEPASSSVYVQ